MAVGFVAWHTYDHKFRQRLKTTADPEMKRLFVLKNLYQRAGYDLALFEQGEIDLGKGMRRKMSPEERRATFARISRLLDDLMLFDPDDPEGEIAEFGQRLGNASPAETE